MNYAQNLGKDRKLAKFRNNIYLFFYTLRKKPKSLT